MRFEPVHTMTDFPALPRDRPRHSGLTRILSERLRVAAALVASLFMASLGGCGRDGLPGQSPEPALRCPAEAEVDGGEAGIVSSQPAGCSLRPLVSPAELASTPRANYDAEVLALYVTGAFVAPQGVYDRVRCDLAKIRRLYPETAGIHARTDAVPGSVRLEFKGPASQLVLANAYHAWDCLNALYEMRVETVFDQGPLATVYLTSRGRLGWRQLVALYAELPGVASADRSGYATNWTYVDNLCVRVDEASYEFTIVRGGDVQCSSCQRPHFWGFSTDMEGQVTLLGEYTPGEGSDNPGWLTNLPCH